MIDRCWRRENRPVGHRRLRGEPRPARTQAMREMSERGASFLSSIAEREEPAFFRQGVRSVALRPEDLNAHLKAEREAGRRPQGQAEELPDGRWMVTTMTGAASEYAELLVREAEVHAQRRW